MSEQKEKLTRYEENVWRSVSGQEPIRSMEEVHERFNDYVRTYKIDFEKCYDDTFLNDMLYGLGAALSDDNKWAQGYAKFKNELLEFLQDEEQQGIYRGRNYRQGDSE